MQIHTHMGVPKSDNFGDFSVAEKLALSSTFLEHGYSVGVDIAETEKGINADEESDMPDNTFRIYRSDSNSPPRELRTGNFVLSLPEFEDSLLKYHLALANILSLDTKILGTGEEATGKISIEDQRLILNIEEGGRGFVDQPSITVLDENRSEILSLNPEWIRMHNGTNYDVQADLLDYEPNARWLRGLLTRTPAALEIELLEDENWKDLVRELLFGFSSIAPEGMSVRHQLTDYFVSYRKDVSDIGVSLHMTTPYRLFRDSLEFFPAEVVTLFIGMNLKRLHLRLSTPYQNSKVSCWILHPRLMTGTVYWYLVPHTRIIQQIGISLQCVGGKQ